MKYEIDDAFIDICKQILAEDKTLDEWFEIESDDMFQDDKYCGGFEEDAFTFSLYDENDVEYWFEVTLEDVKNIAEGNLKTVDMRLADK